MVRHQSEDKRKPSDKELKMQKRRQAQNNKMRERYYEEPEEVVTHQKTQVEKTEKVQKEFVGIGRRYAIATTHMNRVRGKSYKDIAKGNSN
jgi:hypothetical protein